MVPLGPAQLENPSHCSPRSPLQKNPATSKPHKVLAPHGGPGITRFCNHAGPGEKEPFQITRPSGNQGNKGKQNTGVLFLLAKQALCKLPEDLWHFKVFPFSTVLLQD